MILFNPRMYYDAYELQGTRYHKKHLSHWTWNPEYRD